MKHDLTKAKMTVGGIPIVGLHAAWFADVPPPVGDITSLHQAVRIVVETGEPTVLLHNGVAKVAIVSADALRTLARILEDEAFESPVFDEVKRQLALDKVGT